MNDSHPWNSDVKFKDSARLRKKEKRRNIRGEGRGKKELHQSHSPRKGKKFDPRMEYDSSRYFSSTKFPRNRDVFLHSQKFFLPDGVWSRKPRSPPPPPPRNRVADMQMRRRGRFLLIRFAYSTLKIRFPRSCANLLSFVLFRGSCAFLAALSPRWNSSPSIVIYSRH